MSVLKTGSGESRTGSALGEAATDLETGRRRIPTISGAGGFGSGLQFAIGLIELLPGFLPVAIHPHSLAMGHLSRQLPE